MPPANRVRLELLCVLLQATLDKPIKSGQVLTGELTMSLPGCGVSNPTFNLSPSQVPTEICYFKQPTRGPRGTLKSKTAGAWIGQSQNQ